MEFQRQLARPTHRLQRQDTCLGKEEPEDTLLAWGQTGCVTHQPVPSQGAAPLSLQVLTPLRQSLGRSPRSTAADPTHDRSAGLLLPPVPSCRRQPRWEQAEALHSRDQLWEREWECGDTGRRSTAPLKQ